MASPTEVRKGKVLDYQERRTSFLRYSIAQGRQAGFMQVTMRNLNTGSSTNANSNPDSVDILHTETVKLEFSYVDGDGYHFMDPETYEDTILDAAIVAMPDFLLKIKSTAFSKLMKNPFKLVPASIEIKVTESPEGVKGDTASNVQNQQPSKQASPFKCRSS